MSIENYDANINGIEAKRQPCEVFSRVVGYIRPVHQWNGGKQSEFGDRKLLELDLESEKNC